MNIISGNIALCKIFGSLDLFTINIQGDQWETVVIQKNTLPTFAIGYHVKLHFNENEVLLFSQQPNVSEKNIFQGEISDILWGRLYCEVKLKYQNEIIKALILVQNFDALNLKIDMKCWFLVRASAIILEKNG